MRSVGAAVLAAAFLLAATGVVWAEKAPEQAYVDAVLDGLVEAGVLTAEQTRKIKQDAAEAAKTVQTAQKPAKKSWVDTMKLSGYTQARFVYHPDARQGEKDNEFLVRRARLNFAVQPTSRARVQIQPDFGEGEVTIKDAWLEYVIGGDKTWRARLGQQKVPFGFETPQSSSRRTSLEMNELARRTIDGNRDTGLVLYYTDPRDAEAFDDLKKHDFGTGDYGTFSVGVYNGQGSANQEVNDQKHLTARFAKPFPVGHDEEGRSRFAEAGASFYGGTYRSPVLGDTGEHLWGVHFYLPPHPLGFQSEYYSGETEGADLDGWYGMGLWRPNDSGTFFVRYDDYNGRRKGKGTAPNDRHRTGIGYAHMIDDQTELTVEYDLEDEDFPGGRSNDQFGLQVQVSY